MSVVPPWVPPDHRPRFFSGIDGARAVETPQLLEVRAGVMTLVQHGGVVLVDGAPGLGKTFSTDLAIAGLGIDIVWVSMPDQPKGKETVARIWSALTGRRPNMRGTTEMELFEDVLDLMADRHLALIIDEGQHLKTSPLRQLRYLYDHERTKVLLVIVGSGVDLNVMRLCPELHNRVDRHVRFNKFGVREATQVARAMHPAYETASAAALTAAWHFAGGCVRNWANLLRIILTIRDDDKGELDQDTVALAIRIHQGESPPKRETSRGRKVA